MFHHFEEREYWPLKELNFHCRQPEVRSHEILNDVGAVLTHVLLLQAFLKEVLKEICVYHRKGPNKSCYELKPQYKDGVSTKG